MGLRHAVALTLILFAPAASAQRADTSAFIKLAREYLQGWKHSLAAVVAEERYTQTVRQFPLGRDIESATNTSRARTLVSDVLLVHVADEQAWLMFRDVLSVDGEPVRDRQRRFDDLFVRPEANVVATARRIADEGARYNLGTLFRNLNTPATALTFLDPKYDGGVRWRSAKRAQLDGREVVELSFEQRQSPFVVRSVQGQSVPVMGRYWVNAASGRIEQTALELSVARAQAVMRVTCSFGPVHGVEPWVPLRMSEEYQMTDRVHETLKGLATYANHRVFQTSTRIVSEQP